MPVRYYYIVFMPTAYYVVEISNYSAATKLELAVKPNLYVIELFLMEMFVIYSDVHTSNAWSVLTHQQYGWSVLTHQQYGWSVLPHCGGPS